MTLSDLSTAILSRDARLSVHQDAGKWRATLAAPSLHVATSGHDTLDAALVAVFVLHDKAVLV